MKKSLLSFLWNTLFTSLFLLTGIACVPIGGGSSSSSSAGTMVAYYMSPIRLSVEGRALDAQTSNAVKNLRARLLAGTNVLTEVTTGTNGDFGLLLFTATNGIYTVSVDDTDGTNNGAYSNSSLDLNVTNIPYFTNGVVIPVVKTN